MEYNTQRPALKISDYGRVVARMVDYAKRLPTRDERTRMANTIIGVMAHLNPKVRERTDYQHILWDHLMVMADYGLDCDCPYTISREETERFRPRQLQVRRRRITYRHYGRALEDMIRAVADMPQGDDRDELTAQIAHTMKRQYLQWNRDTVDDGLIRDQLAELSDGKLTLPADFQFHDSAELLQAIGQSQGDTAKKKKKKKKKKANGKL